MELALRPRAADTYSTCPKFSAVHAATSRVLGRVLKLYPPLFVDLLFRGRGRIKLFKNAQGSSKLARLNVAHVKG